MEIIVALVILSLTMVGMLNVFISAKKYSLLSRSRVTAGQLGKYFIDPLQMQVRQDTWNNTNNCIGPNATSGCPSAKGVGTITYTPNYTINGVTGTTLRRVKVDVSWTQP